MKIAILSDIHGNHYALEQVLKAAKQNKVEKLLVLGDIVGYYYHPDKVLSMLDEWDYELIKGNHEKLIEGLLNNTIDASTLQKKYGSGHRMALDKLTKTQITKLISASEKKEITLNDTTILMCHGTNWDSDFYLYPDSDQKLLEKGNVVGVDFVVIGHSHYSFVHRNTNSTLINVGSVGQSRSVGGIANWIVINTRNNCFELKATPYDVKPLIEEIERIDPEVNYLKKILIRNNP